MNPFLRLPYLYLLFVAIFTVHVSAQQIFNSNVQSAYDPSDTPEVPVAPIQPPAPISSSPAESVEESVEELPAESVEELPAESVEISVEISSQIIAGGEDAEVALNSFVQTKNYDLTNSSDIDQIVGELENELNAAPEQSASVAVTLSTLVTTDFLSAEIIGDGALSGSSIAVAVQNSLNVIAQSSKFRQLVTNANVVNIKQGMVSSIAKLLEDSGLSGEEITAALKKVEEIVEGQLETITVNGGSTDVGPLAQVSL